MSKMNERGALRLTLHAQDAVVVFPTGDDSKALTVRVASLLPGEVTLMFKGDQEVWRDKIYSSPEQMRKHKG